MKTERNNNNGNDCWNVIARPSKLARKHLRAYDNISKERQWLGIACRTPPLIVHAFSDVKRLQRRISLEVEAHVNISQKQKERVGGCGLVLKDLNHEANYLRGEIGLMKE